jgi:hypothetical protein
MRSAASLALDISVGRQWSNLESLRGTVQASMEAAGLDPEMARMAALAAHELGENAVKYGSWDRNDDHFTVHVTIDAATVTIRVENPLAGADVPESLLQAIEHIEQHADDALTAKVQEIAQSGIDQGGLGLARLAYEAGCQLRAEAHDGRLAVIAELPRAGLTARMIARTSSGVDALSAGELTITAAREGSSLVLAWQGKSVEREPGKILAPYFAGALDEAASQNLALELRFAALEHFNSSTITALIALVQKARAAKVKLVLVYDKAVRWQKLAFEALRALDKKDGLLELRAV